MESSQYNRPSTHSQRTLSPSNSREMFMTSNTVPVYRHGRKFYVSMDEFERMRAEERRHRRTLMQKSQNLPVSKSHSINYRAPSSFLYNPIHRSSSNPHEHRYGVLRAPHLPVNSMINDPTTNFNRHDSTRQSRSTFRYYDDRDEQSSITSALPIRLPTTAVRSNSSDKVLDLRRTPQPSKPSYNGYITDDYELKRSVSAEVVQPTPPIQTQQPQVMPRRTTPVATADYSMSTGSTDQTYNQSNASKLTSYFSRMQPLTLNSLTKSSTSTPTGTGSTYETGMQESDHHYSVVATSNRRSGTGLTSVLSRSPTTNSNPDYYPRDTITSGSLSDDNSSSPSTLNQRRNTDNYRYRRAQLIVETDDDYGQSNEAWSRPTTRSHSSDGLTEKKRVRFADMEGFTLETVPDIEQQRSPMTSRLLSRRSHGHSSSHLQGHIQPFQNSFYQATTRVGGNGSKLATDV